MTPSRKPLLHRIAAFLHAILPIHPIDRGEAKDTKDKRVLSVETHQGSIPPSGRVGRDWLEAHLPSVSAIKVVRSVELYPFQPRQPQPSPAASIASVAGTAWARSAYRLPAPTLVSWLPTACYDQSSAISSS